MLWQYFDQYWTEFHPVVFDGNARRIYVAPEISTINIEPDIYSSWKEWVALDDNAKYIQAMRSVGGDTLPNGDKLGSTFFVINGWKIVIDHGIDFIGNMYAEGAPSPFVTEVGQQLTSTQVSNLVDKIAPNETVLESVFEAANIPTAEANADAVWNEPTVDHKDAGTFGKFVSTILTIKKFIGLK